MILSEGALVITTEGTLHRIDIWMHPELVEESHPGSRLLRFLIAEAAVCVDEEWVQGP